MITSPRKEASSVFCASEFPFLQSGHYFFFFSFSLSLLPLLLPHPFFLLLLACTTMMSGYLFTLTRSLQQCWAAQLSRFGSYAPVIGSTNPAQEVQSQIPLD